MDFDFLEPGLAQILWPAPHHILPVNDDEEERLFPFDERLMNLPDLQIQDLGLLIRGQSPPPPDQGPSQILKHDLHSNRLPEHWPVYKDMNYLGFEEENQEIWEETQDMEEEEEEQDEDLDDEKIMTSNTSEQGPGDVSLPTKRRDPISDDRQLLRDIKSLAEPHIPTVGLQEVTMSDDASPVFVPMLEPRRTRS